MDFEFDKNKSEVNKQKHGIDFNIIVFTIGIE